MGATATTMAILPLQAQATQARTVVKAALSQAAMEEMVAVAVPLAVSLFIICHCVGPCISHMPVGNTSIAYWHTHLSAALLL